MRGCSCWSGLLKGLLGMLARMCQDEMAFVEFRCGRMSVEFVDKGWDVRRQEEARLRFDGKRCQASLMGLRELLMRGGGDHSIA